MNAIDFAAVLTAKLEKVLEKQNQRERMDRKLKEVRCDTKNLMERMFNTKSLP